MNQDAKDNFAKGFDLVYSGRVSYSELKTLTPEEVSALSEAANASERAEIVCGGCDELKTECNKLHIECHNRVDADEVVTTNSQIAEALACSERAARGAEIKVHFEVTSELTSPAFTPPPFEEWPKMDRYRSVHCFITEKIDGTNAQIIVPSNPSDPIIAGSRTRYVGPLFGTDNFGFGAWVHANQEALRRLSPGKHYGEWWGHGIQRRYGLTEKRFSLFNAGRWTLNPETGKGGLPEGLPPEVGVVPILYRGIFDGRKVDEVIAKLFREGSVAVPGWRSPEGVVVRVGSQSWKLTDNGDAKKGRAHHVDAAMGAITYDIVESCVYGFDADGFRHVQHVNNDMDDATIRSEMYKVADRIVTYDSAIMDARKASQETA